MVRPADPPPEGYGITTLALYVIERLPNGYLIQPNDKRWLDFCDDHLQGEPTNESVLEATKRAVELHSGRLHCDPFELLVDAEICDVKLNVG
jgi:hypothetical protein